MQKRPTPTLSGLVPVLVVASWTIGDCGNAAYEDFSNR
jgi:hypothetical protein